MSEKIIQVRQQNVIIDVDVAALYQVDTREINQAVNRNPDKFPDGYVIALTHEEKTEVITNCDHLQSLKFSKALPKAFTEKGLYMLATILKSPIATQTTLLIIETFSKIKELTQAVYQFSKAKTDEQRVKIFENSTDIVSELLDNPLTVSQQETSFKIKLPFLKSLEKQRK